MPIAVLGLSGYCNSYWTTVAVICNNLLFNNINK
jgi:hypothetical protein